MPVCRKEYEGYSLFLQEKIYAEQTLFSVDWVNSISMCYL